MHTRWLFGAATAALMVFGAGQSHAQVLAGQVLAGQVTSAEEGAMEGVVVSARKQGSNITVSVVTNAQGRFSFPASRLDAGQYTVTARAANPERFRKAAEYFSTVNLSNTEAWDYELKTLARVKGRGTNVVITEYDLPRPTIEPHDVVIKDGTVWYTNFGEQFLGKLDPKTGKHSEYPMPVLKEGYPAGNLDLGIDKEGKLWLGMMYQAAIARFDPQTEDFRLWK